MSHHTLALGLLSVVVAACGGVPASTTAPMPGTIASIELVADVDVGGRTMQILRRARRDGLAAGIGAA